MNQTIPNLTEYQWKTVFYAVKQYQNTRTELNSDDYWQCAEILDQLFDLVYTQTQEQPR